MYLRISTVLVATALYLVGCSSSTDRIDQPEESPVAVIFDTDMGPDYDDVGAIAVLHALADSGDAKILATMASTRHDNVAPVLDILNTWFGRPDIPVGVPGEGALTLRDPQHWSDTLVGRYPHNISRNDDARDATQLYRQILSEQPDTSVTIVTVGFLTNIAALMKSPADEFSELDGHDLMKKKVKRLVSMAGKFPEGMEFNIEEDAAAAKYVFDNLEVPVLFSGFEIGRKIKTGLPLVNDDDIPDNPVKDVYRIALPMAEGDLYGRMSWDQTAVLVAIKGYAPWYDVKKGHIVVNEEGYNTWSEAGDAHSYLVEEVPAAEVEKMINDLMMHQPVARAANP